MEGEGAGAVREGESVGNGGSYFEYGFVLHPFSRRILTDWPTQRVRRLCWRERRLRGREKRLIGVWIRFPPFVSSNSNRLAPCRE